MIERECTVLALSAQVVPAVAAPGLVKMLGYWRERWREGRLPARAEIDPVDFAPLLPDIAILDVLDDGMFRFRLVGETVNARYGQLKGKRLDQILRGEVLERTLSEHWLCVERAAPVFIRNTEFTRSIDGDFQVFQRLLLPLADDGVSVDAIFVLNHFEGP